MSSKRDVEIQVFQGDPINISFCHITDDSWLGDDNRTMSDFHSETGDRLYSGRESIYSGRQSPVKAYNPKTYEERLARASAFSSSTTDSFDYAFQRPGNSSSATSRGTRDDFFD